MTRVTAQDVAEAAGVSLATVDRVLNNRKGVREATIERVMAAMDRLNFVRDQTAANLARGRRYRFTFIVPHAEVAFYKDLRAEIEDARKSFAKDRIDVHMVAIPPLDPQALVDAIEALGDEIGDGVAMVAIESPIVREAIRALRNKGVHVVSFISDVPSSAREHYVGIDNVAAGRVAGSLLKRFIHADSGKVAVVAGSGILRDHVERRMGLEQVMRAECPHLTVLPWIEGGELYEVVEEKLTELIEAHDDLVGVYSLGGGSRGVISAVRKARQDLRVVTTELSEYARAALIAGEIDAVLVQDPSHEVRSAIRVLKALNDDMPIHEKQERIRIEIFVRDNLP